MDWKGLEESLRAAEKDIAENPEAHGTTAEAWERVRQWPGEFHPKPKQRHIHIAERCEHGETKSDCGHPIPWSWFRVRSVPCSPEFCPAAEVDGDGSDQQGQG